MKKFPFVRQLDAMDCGAACLKMITKFYGKDYSLDDLRERSHITHLGVFSEKTQIFQKQKRIPYPEFKNGRQRAIKYDCSLGFKTLLYYRISRIILFISTKKTKLHF